MNTPILSPLNVVTPSAQPPMRSGDAADTASANFGETLARAADIRPRNEATPRRETVPPPQKAASNENRRAGRSAESTAGSKDTPTRESSAAPKPKQQQAESDDSQDAPQASAAGAASLSTAPAEPLADLPVQAVVDATPAAMTAVDTDSATSPAALNATLDGQPSQAAAATAATDIHATGAQLTTAASTAPAGQPTQALRPADKAVADLHSEDAEASIRLDGNAELSARAAAAAERHFGPRRPEPGGAGPAPTPQRAPISEELVELLASADGEQDAAAVVDRSFEQLLAARPAISARAEPALQAVPFAHLSAMSSMAARGEPVATMPGQPGFAQDFGQRVVLLAAGKISSAELALTPAELGPVRISIELRGQDATLSFVANAAATRAAIEDALPKLREMFAQQGLTLLDASVGAHVGQQGRPSHGQKQTANGHGRSGVEAAANAEANRLLPTANRPRRLIDVIA